jgi:hypothetical protein
MSPLLVLIATATAAVGIEVGWEPLPDGGHEYSIQLEPDLCDLLRRGTDEITSEVPPNINVRRYRMFVGTGKLPKIDGPAQPPGAPEFPPEPPAHKPAASTPATGQLEPPDNPASPEGQRRTADHRGLDFPAPPHQAASEQGHAPGHLSTDGEHPAPLEPASFAEPDETRHGKAADSGKHDGAKADTTAHGGAKQDLGKHGADAQGADTHGANGSAAKGDEPKGNHTASEEERPWLPFSIAVTLLACSLGGNVYLAWIAWEARGRCRETLARLRTAPAS